MNQFLPHLGLIVGIALIWYGRSHASDLRIIGYIIIAPSLFGLAKKYGGVDLSGKLQGGAPASGEAFPQGNGDSVATQETEESSVLTSPFQPPGTSVVRFGSQSGGAQHVNASVPSFSLAPPGSFRGARKY